MKSTHLILLLIFLFSSCKKLNKEHDSENHSKEKVEIELENGKPNAEQLLNKANTYFVNRKFEESKKELRILLKKYPTSNEVQNANILMTKANIELDKIQREENIIRDEEKKNNELKIELATKKMKKKVDKLENITWYQDKTSPQYINYNGFFLYIGDSGYNYPTLRLRIQYKDNDWLFIEKYIIYVDGLKYKTIETKYGDVKRDNGSGGVWEWIDISIDKYNEDDVNDFDVIRAMINGKDVKIKFIGSQYSKVKTITKEQKNALKNVLEVYEVLGGELY
ncbi:MAG: hypothetical protein Q7J19_02325 [Lutibacter sp.]|jgi:hypothetical protein|nr:hypothetical protein [Lutibacter sp.]